MFFVRGDLPVCHDIILDHLFCVLLNEHAMRIYLIHIKYYQRNFIRFKNFPNYYIYLSSLSFLYCLVVKWKFLSDVFVGEHSSDSSVIKKCIEMSVIKYARSIPLNMMLIWEFDDCLTTVSQPMMSRGNFSIICFIYTDR